MSNAAVLPGSAPAVARRHLAGRFLVYAIVLAIAAALAFAPFLFPDVRAQEVAARICVFVVLVASYDLLIGYTGIVSFAHTMFFGLGAYGTAIALKAMGPGFDAILVGGSAGVLAAIVLAVLIGLLSLRVKAIFFAMITLAAASVMMVLASQFFEYTGGEDGITYTIPRFFSPANMLIEGEAVSPRSTGREPFTSRAVKRAAPIAKVTSIAMPRAASTSSIVRNDSINDVGDRGSVGSCRGEAAAQRPNSRMIGSAA